MHWKNGHFLQHLVEASTKEEDEIKIVNLNKVTIEININHADIFSKHLKETSIEEEEENKIVTLQEVTIGIKKRTSTQKRLLQSGYFFRTPGENDLEQTLTEEEDEIKIVTVKEVIIEIKTNINPKKFQQIYIILHRIVWIVIMR